MFRVRSISATMEQYLEGRSNKPRSSRLHARRYVLYCVAYTYRSLDRKT